MGGADITSTAYTGGVINIPSVTGNVEITAIATKTATYTNLFSPTDTDFADAIIAILTLIGKIYSAVRKMSKEFVIIKEHTEENYLNNLRLVIMSPDMPIGERLSAGEKYINAHGNGEVKAFYKKLQKEYLESEET